MRPFAFALVLLLAGAPDGGAPGPAQRAAREGVAATEQAVSAARELEAVAAAIARTQRAAARLQDFRATFHKREYKGGPLPAEEILLKFRASPRSVYLKWTGDAYRGQEAIWRRGWNGDRLRVHTGSFPDVTVDLQPTSWWAMRAQRHPATQAGFDFTLEMFARDLARGRERPACLPRAADLGPQTLFGRPGRCFELETDKALCPEMYAAKARVCLDEALGLPSKVEVWDREDGELRLVEEYGYANVQVDVGLGDEDFDPENDEYDF